jgi:hypothetical protein
VKFPSCIANHNADQVFYYDKDYMLRRMDYSPDVTGNPPVAHYTRDPKTFDGFVSPTRRLVHLHNAKGIADQSFAAITINIDAVSVEIDSVTSNNETFKCHSQKFMSSKVDTTSVA